MAVNYQGTLNVLEACRYVYRLGEERCFRDTSTGNILRSRFSEDQEADTCRSLRWYFSSLPADAVEIAGNVTLAGGKIAGI